MACRKTSPLQRRVFALNSTTSLQRQSRTHSAHSKKWRTLLSADRAINRLSAADKSIRQLCALGSQFLASCSRDKAEITRLRSDHNAIMYDLKRVSLFHVPAITTVSCSFILIELNLSHRYLHSNRYSPTSGQVRARLLDTSHVTFNDQNIAEHLNM